MRTYRESIEIEVQGLITAAKDDLGYMVNGSAAGVFAYLFGDYRLECCREYISDGKCKLTISTKDVLAERGFEVAECDKLPENTNFYDYTIHNTAEKSKSERSSSLGQLLAKGIVSYTPGVVKLNVPNERLVFIEINLLYDIEATFDEEVVTEASYAAFYKLGLASKRKENVLNELSVLLSAFGYGTISITKGEGDNYLFITFNGYPWIPNVKKLNFASIKGAVSGFLNSSTGEKYVVKDVSSEMVNNIFNVKLELESGGRQN